MCSVIITGFAKAGTHTSVPNRAGMVIESACECSEANHLIGLCKKELSRILGHRLSSLYREVVDLWIQRFA